MTALFFRNPAHIFLILTAAFAMTWIVHRACVQSITLDEADTFEHWVASAGPRHWEPHSNNHVLNSSLMRLSVWFFGRSELVIRLPALAGGAIYIYTIFRLCMLLTGSSVLRWALLVCFSYNPFIMDYLVAARGYGLALGFLALGIYLFVRGAIGEGPTLREIAAMSACVGLSICANFSFAYAGGSLLLAGTAWAWWGSARGWMAVLRLGAACVIPAMLVLLVLAGSALTRFPRDQLFWGTDSLLAMWHDLREGCFLELNPFLVNPLLGQVLGWVKLHLFQALAVFASAYILVLCGCWPKPEARLRFLLAGTLGLVLGFTLLAHWLQFKLFGIPLPFERTSIFLLPLATALMGVALSVAPESRVTRLVQGFGVSILLLAGIYFIGELRDSYFREWRNDSEIKVAFPHIVDLCRRHGVREVTVDWNFPNSLNFYRGMYGGADFDEVQHPPESLPRGKPIYVLSEGTSATFIREEGLTTVWHGTVSDLVVAIGPALK